MASGRANQATNQSILLGPVSVTEVPVSCEDSGKWNSPEFEEKFSGTLESFPLLDDQVGILAFLDRQLLGLDVLGAPELYAPVHCRLLGGHLTTALSAGNGSPFHEPAEEPELKALAQALQNARRENARASVEASTRLSTAP
jgi:hypothetical protein